MLTCEHETGHSFKLIQEGLVRQHGVGTPYTRFSKKEGHFILSKSVVTPALLAKLQQGVRVGEDLIAVKKGEGKELDEFWEKHGFHYNGIMDRLQRDHEKRDRVERRASLGRREFELAGRVFPDVNRLKSDLKMVLAKTGNGKPVAEEHCALLRELLRHHPKAEAKGAHLKGFSVDKHPEHPETRCFFTVKEDGSR